MTNARVIANDLAIVVIGRNEGQRLLKCLASVRTIASNIVYVDSGSTDGSPAAAARLGFPVINLDSALPFSAARARNEGFRALDALNPRIRFVQFIDGDCELVHSWLDVALAFIERRSDVAIVCGRRREIYPHASIYNRLCDIEWDTPIGETSACGGDALVRVKAFEAVTGFRPQIVAGEEPELCLRLRERGWKIWRLDAEMTLHDVAITRFTQWWARIVRSGFGYAEVSRLHRHSSSGIYRRETVRAIFWGGLIPAVIGFGALLHPAALWGSLIYPLQFCRIVIARGPVSSESWTYALLMMVAKFAELQGILKFYWSRGRRHAKKPIEYKQIS